MGVLQTTHSFHRWHSGPRRRSLHNMSLDETGLKVWQTKRPPLAMLVSAKASEMLGAQLSVELQAPFLSLSTSLLDWWPTRKPEPIQIYETELRACLDVYGENESAAKMQPMLKSANLQMAALLQIAPRSLPAGDYYSLDENSFQELLRDAAKVGRLPVAQLEARLKHLLEHEKEIWPKLIARADRMSWTRGTSWAKLTKRVRALASLADLGAVSSWIEVSGQHALRLELDGTKRIAMLSPEELASLSRVIPTIVEPSSDPERDAHRSQD